MPKFSERSRNNLNECAMEIQHWLEEAIEDGPDFTVICGYRNEADQNSAFANGYSKLKYPQSKHNTFPSVAVDVVPYPIDWEDIDRFKELAVHLKKIAKKHEIDVQWGGDWTSFKDYPHWQLG